VTTTIDKVATTVDELVHRTADDQFEMKARLYGCDPDGAYILGEGDDPYDLLWVTDKPENIDAMALVVTGWASPYNGEDKDNMVAPSKHPERIRIRLVTCLGYEGFATIMRRADKPEEVTNMGDEGEGALRDALEAWWGR
jgi:hypothetical protein